MQQLGLLVVLLVPFFLASCAEESPSTPAEVAELQEAANKGDAVSQALIGIHYYYGWVLPKDYKQAVFWYQKAADQGYASAQINLGACYLNGEGVPKDFVTAYKWFNLAAETVADAADTRNMLTRNMTPEQIAEGQRRSSEFKARPEVPVK